MPRNQVHIPEYLFDGMNSAIVGIGQALQKEAMLLLGVGAEPGGFIRTVSEGFEGLLDQLFGGDGAVLLQFLSDDLGAALGEFEAYGGSIVPVSG